MSHVPGDIIPPELMYFEKRRAVFNWLLALPIDGQSKVDLFMYWGKWVASSTSQRERDKLFASGV